MKFLPRREDHAARKAKAFKATEMGMAGHQATMRALNPGFDRMAVDSVNMRTGESVALGRGHVRLKGEDEHGWPINDKGGYEGVYPARLTKDND